MIKDIYNLISISNKSIIRDKCYLSLNNKYKISSFNFRKHWERLNYKSTYHFKYNRRPKEKKYKDVWTLGKINFDFENTIFNDVWYTDITYVKVNKVYKMILLIINEFSKKVLYLEEVKNRTAGTILLAMKKVKEITKKFPKILHSDHGIEYANFFFKNFLEKNQIIQSMSPKNKSLANRSSEFFFSTFKREFFYPNKNSLLTSEDLKLLINKFLIWYHNFRIQRNLQNKTPSTVYLESYKNLNYMS